MRTIGWKQQVYRHKFAIIFRKPVNPKDAPGYEKVSPTTDEYVQFCFKYQYLYNGMSIRVGCRNVPGIVLAWLAYMVFWRSASSSLAG